MIKAIGCHCGSTDSLIRNFLKSANYPDWLNIPIQKGKEASLSTLNSLPPSVEKDILRTFLEGASKWAVVIGYDDKTCRWSDIAHNGMKSRIEAQVVVELYSDFTNRR